MDFKNLSPVKGTTKNPNATIGAASKGTPRVKKEKVEKIKQDITYNGNGTFRFTKNFVAKLGEVNGIDALSNPKATLATVNEFAFKVSPKETAKYLGTARTGVNPNTKEVVQGKPSTLITHRILEAYLINTNQITKDVKTALTLSKVEENNETYFVFGGSNATAQVEAVATETQPTEIQSEVEVEDEEL